MPCDDEVTLGNAETFLSAKRPFNISEDILSVMKGSSRIDQNILDEIGVESTDSDSEDDNMPVPSLYVPSRNSSLSRSKSVDSFEPSVQDDDSYSGAKFCAGNTVMPRSKRFATGIEPQQPAQFLGVGMRRSASMPCFQKSRSDYNRAVGEALANSPKKAPVNTQNDLAIMEMLLSEL